jgi:hypothetical protein
MSQLSFLLRLSFFQSLSGILNHVVSLIIERILLYRRGFMASSFCGADVSSSQFKLGT